MQGTAHHNNWQTGIINKNTSCLLLSGKNFQLKRGSEYNRLRVGDPSLPSRLGTTLTSVLHPKLILRGSKARSNSLYNHFSQNFCRLWAENWRFIVSAWGRVRKPDSASLVPHIHALHFFFSTAQLMGHVVSWQRGTLSLLGKVKTATVKSLENSVGLDRETPEKSTWIGLETSAEQRSSSDVLTAACLMS